MNIPETPKIVGHCTCCDKPCYGDISYFPEGHALAGRPRNVGAILPETRRMEFLMSDSTTMTLTFCGNCGSDTEDGCTVGPQNYPTIMERVLLSCAEEISDVHRAALGLERWSDERKADYLERMSRLFIAAKWCDRPPEAG